MCSSDLFGDDTAKRMGRMSLNPLRHVDPFGTIVLPGILLLMRAPFLFGYAKPVPVNFWRLNNPKRDMVWVAAAGPAMNILLAVISALLFHTLGVLPPWMSGWVAENLANSVQINAVLAVFNMLPLPPLDGGRVAVGLLPRALSNPLARLERWGLAIIVGVLFLLPMISRNLDVAPWLLGRPIDALIRVITTVTGLS